MKYFIDTEFIEKPNTIELISIGVRCEDGGEFYAVSNEFNAENASDWVKENVIAKLGNDYNRSSIAEIKEALLKFIIGKNIRFYGYYSDYDWVVFCWIFGTMMELPEGFPMYCIDLKQMMDERGLTKEWKEEKCPELEGQHNALVDANWNYYLYKRIQEAQI